MNAPREFAETVWRQFYFLRDCRELDDYYLNQVQSKWKPRETRRGWTRQDIRRLEQFHSAVETNPPIVSIYTGKPCSTRVSTALKLWRFDTICDIKRRNAICFCQQNPEFGIDEPAIIQRMAKIHREALRCIRSGYDAGEAAIKNEWEECYRELERAVKAIDDACVDPEIEAGEYLNNHPEDTIENVLERFGISVSAKTFKEHLEAKTFPLKKRKRGKKTSL